MEEVLIVLGGYNNQSEKVVDVFAYSYSLQKWFFLTPLIFPLGREFASSSYPPRTKIEPPSATIACRRLP
jgi:hypothetical protein